MHAASADSEGRVLPLQAKTLAKEALRNAHSGRISGVVFPTGYSEVFATCGKDGVRVWQTASRKQLLKIQVDGLDCTSILFSKVQALPALKKLKIRCSPHCRARTPQPICIIFCLCLRPALRDTYIVRWGVKVSCCGPTSCLCLKGAMWVELTVDGGPRWLCVQASGGAGSPVKGSAC